MLIRRPFESFGYLLGGVGSLSMRLFQGNIETKGLSEKTITMRVMGNEESCKAEDSIARAR